MPTTTKRTEVPAKSQPKVEQVEFMGWANREGRAPEWVFDWEYPVPVDAKRRLQVRDMETYDKPDAMVTQLAQAIKNGDTPPAVVITRDGWIADGNTTMRATHRAGGRPTLHAIVIQIDYESASESARDRLRTLGSRLNRHGKNMSPTEIARLVIQSHQYDARMSAAELAQRHRTTERAVNDILAEYRARTRAERLDMTINGSMPPTHLRRLGRVSLNDGPFIGLARLVQDAGLTVTELNDLITRVRGTGTDQGAQDLLEKEREARKDQIADFSIREKRRPSKSSALRQHLGFILGFEEDPEVLVEKSPNFAAQHEEMIAKAVTILAEVLAARPLEVPEHRAHVLRAVEILAEVSQEAAARV